MPEHKDEEGEALGNPNALAAGGSAQQVTGCVHQKKIPRDQEIPG